MINFNEKYNNLKIRIDENIAKVSNSYETSTICFQDKIVIDSISSALTLLSSLSGTISDAKTYSSNVGYTNTFDSLGTLSTKVDYFSDIFEELSDIIKTTSMEVYDELIGLFNGLRRNYVAFRQTLATEFQKYDLAAAEFSEYNNWLVSHDKTNPLYNSYVKRRGEANTKRKNASEQITNLLEQLENTVANKMEELLEDGLKKSSI